MPAAYMVALARELEVVLGELHPEYPWVVEVRKGDLDVRSAPPAVAARVDEAGAAADDPHTSVDRDDMAAATGSRDKDGLSDAA